MNPFDDVDSSYGCEQAVEDGVLFHPYPKRWPWLLISINVKAACEPTATDKRTYDQKLTPLLMDAIMAAQSPKGTKILREGGKIRLDGTVAGLVIIGRNEKGGMTVCQPCED